MNHTRSLYKPPRKSMKVVKAMNRIATTTAQKAQKFKSAKGPRETVEQFLKRGGTVTVYPPRYLSAGFGPYKSVRAWL